ncbi:MAG: replication-associated recombination protein A [Bacteroidetes bacterium]|nr:replication-associated recombination protein A [Bacteroidota bacterium]
MSIHQSHIIPLAERIRPSTLDELIGQDHLTGPGSILRMAIDQKNIPSIILWGPPGVGKTTLAHIIAKNSEVPFYRLSAISSGVKDVREVIDKAAKESGAILFIDEIHRFNKGQQDALLNAVEKGIITLIGATTENPSFEVNPALLSRCQVYVLKPLEEKAMIRILENAVQKDEKLKEMNPQIKEVEALIRISGGDVRKILNLLELATDIAQKDQATGQPVITNEEVLKAAQSKVALYDKNGEQHYDIISAFIKSMRGTDPNAAVYWLARMIEGGEDVKLIARRMVIFASEDIGNANPNALLLANTCFDAVHKIGYPESRIILSQCAIYLATSVKSNAAYEAISKALDAVKSSGDLPVPLHIRNAPTGLMKDLDYGKNYQYAHAYKNNFTQQEYLPRHLEGSVFYIPQDNPKENEIRRFLKSLWKEKYGY